MGMLSWRVLVLTLISPFPLLSVGSVGGATAEQNGQGKVSAEDPLFEPPIQMGSFSRIASLLPIQILGNFPSTVSSIWHSHRFWETFHPASLYRRSFNMLNCAVNKGSCVQGATRAVQAHQHSGLSFASLHMISEDNFLWLRHFHKSREGAPQEIPLFIY